MSYLLDTNICIYIIKKKPVTVLTKFRKIIPGEIGISSITVAELQYGVEKSSNRERNRKALNDFLIPLNIYDFDYNAALFYGEIRAYLEKKGKVIGPMDMLIAANALSTSSILITNNVKEFKRIPNLEIENWV